MIYEQFWVTGTDSSVETYTDLFTIAVRNDDIQEFDSKWDGKLLSMTKIPHDDILEGLNTLRIRESEKLKTVLELYDLETHQKKLGPDYHRLKAMVKRSIEQEIRNKNFWDRSGNFGKNAVVKNQGTKQRVQRILGDCWQWETNGQCVKGNNCSFRHDMNKRGKSGKKLGRNSSKRQLSDARQLGCVFQDMTPPKSILRKSTDMPKTIQRVKFKKAIARHTKIRDQNPSLGYICPGEPHERSPKALNFEDRSQEETEWQEQGAREAAWKLAKSVFKLKEHERAAFFSSPENRCLPASTLKPEEREFVVDSGASMHMISKKDLSDAEMDTLTKSCSLTIVITANGEVQTHEEATVYVKELNIFLTMKVLENTPAVLSLGKLCDENGYSYEWINGQKPHLIKNGIRVPCNTENFVPVVVPGLSSSSSGSSSSSASSSSPTVSEIQIREREDRIDNDITPVQVSCSVGDGSGQPDETQANKNPKPNKKETTIERGNPLYSEIPEWLQELREILVDDENPFLGRLSRQFFS